VTVAMLQTVAALIAVEASARSQCTARQAGSWRPVARPASKDLGTPDCPAES